MPILRPDLYRHNNPNLPIVDIAEVKGGFKAVDTVANMLAIPADKLVANTYVFAADTGKLYRLVNAAAPTLIASWEEQVIPVVADDNSVVANTIDVAAPSNTPTVILVKVANANTGAVSIVINSQAPLAVETSDGPLTNGQIAAGTFLLLAYTGTIYQVVGGIGSGGAVQLEDDGTPLPLQNTINFVGPFTLTDNVTKTDVAIPNNSITDVYLATVPTSTIRGRVTAGTGNIENLSVAQAKTLLEVPTPTGAAGAVQLSNGTGGLTSDPSFTFDTVNNQLLIGGTTTDGSTISLQVEDSDNTTVFSVDTKGRIGLSSNNFLVDVSNADTTGVFLFTNTTGITTATNTMVIGNAGSGLLNGNNDNTIIGMLAGSAVNGDDNTILGTRAGNTSAGSNNTLIGADANANGGTSNNVVVGRAAATTSSDCKVIGVGASTTASNQFVAGSVTSPTTLVAFGNGVAALNTNGADTAIVGSSATGAGNLNGGNLVLRPGTGINSGSNGELRLQSSDSTVRVTVARTTGGTGLVSINGVTGFVLPVVTTVQRDTLSPTNGMLIYNSTTNRFSAYKDSAWQDLDRNTAVKQLEFHPSLSTTASLFFKAGQSIDAVTFDLAEIDSIAYAHRAAGTAAWTTVLDFAALQAAVNANYALTNYYIRLTVTFDTLWVDAAQVIIDYSN